jgi:signal peptidase II
MRRPEIKQYLYILIVVGILQICDFLVFKSRNYTLNQKLFFGMTTSHFWLEAILFIALVILTLKFFQYLGSIRGIVLIVAGGLSNLFDRVFYGGVIDYFQLYNFPIFNMADLLLTLGVLLLCWELFFQNKTPSKT